MLTSRSASQPDGITSSSISSPRQQTSRLQDLWYSTGDQTWMSQSGLQSSALLSWLSTYVHPFSVTIGSANNPEVVACQQLWWNRILARHCQSSYHDCSNPQHPCGRVGWWAKPRPIGFPILERSWSIRRISTWGSKRKIPRLLGLLLSSLFWIYRMSHPKDGNRLLTVSTGNWGRGYDLWRDSKPSEECSTSRQADLLENCLFLHPWRLGSWNGCPVWQWAAHWSYQAIY